MILKDIAPLGVPEPLQGLFFYLAHPLAGKVEDLAHLFKGVLVLVIEAETHLQDAALSGIQGLQSL